MGNMREIRNRIKSVQDTMKITNAMYLISSAKLRKARSNRDDTAPYFESLKYTISDILERYPAFQEQGLFESEAERNMAHQEKDRLFIVISSDKGLAGSYNHNVFSLVEENMVHTARNKLLLIGHMGINYFRKNPEVDIDEEHIHPATTPTIFRAREIAEYVIDQYLHHDIDEVHMVYTKMVNSMTFEPEIMKVLPLARSLFCDRADKHLQEPVFSPSPEEVLKHIVPNYVKGIIFGAMSESFACEQSARMTAMDNATTNAKDMIRDLSLAYNRVRQAAITQEITEVVSGSQSTR